MMCYQADILGTAWGIFHCVSVVIRISLRYQHAHIERKSYQKFFKPLRIHHSQKSCK